MEPGLEVSAWPSAGCKSEDNAVLHGAMLELRSEMNNFRRGVERQLEDVLRLAGPLSRSVADLQCENRRLREQVDRLSRQVELLSRAAGLSEEGPVRFSSHALLSLSGKAQSVVPEVENDVETTCTTASSVVENGHKSLSDKDKVSHDSSITATVSNTRTPSPTPHVRMPHMPVTAVTKVVGEAPPSVSNGSSRQYGQEPKSPTEASPKQSNTQSAVRTWNASIVKTMGVSCSSEKTVSSTKTTQSYSIASSTVSSER